MHYPADYSSTHSYIVKSLIIILSFLLMLTGCDNSEVTNQKQKNERYQQIAYKRYDEACDKLNMTQTELNLCSLKITKEIDKEIIELTKVPLSQYHKDSGKFSLGDFKESAGEAIDQEYPCQDPVFNIDIEKFLLLQIEFYCEPEIYGGRGPQNNVDPDVCKNYTDNKKRIDLRESGTDRMFDDNGLCLEQIDYGSIQPLRNNLLYIQKGEEYKLMVRDALTVDGWIKDVKESDKEVWKKIQENILYKNQNETN